MAHRSADGDRARHGSARRDGRGQEPLRGDAGERGLLATAAFERTLEGGSADEVRALAERAAICAELPDRDGRQLSFALLVEAFLAADAYDRAEALNRTATQQARAGGLRIAAGTHVWLTALIAAARGALPDAVAHAERAAAEARTLGNLGALQARATATLVGALLGRGLVEAAREALAGVEDPGSLSGHTLQVAQAQVRLAEGDAAGAGMAREAMIEEGKWGTGNPGYLPLGSLLAQARLALATAPARPLRRPRSSARARVGRQDAGRPAEAGAEDRVAQLGPAHVRGERALQLDARP